MSKKIKVSLSKKKYNKSKKNKLSCLPIKHIDQYKKDYTIIDNLNEYRDIFPYSEKTKKNLIDKIKVGLIYKEKNDKTENCIVNIGIMKKPFSKVGYLDENNPHDILFDKKLSNKNFGDKIKNKKKIYTVVPYIYITTRNLKNKNVKGGFSEPLGTFLEFFK